MGYLSVLRPLFRRRFPDFADLLPWDEVLDRQEGIWSTKDDGLLTMCRVWPRDLQGLELSEQGVLMLRINEAFKRLPAGWQAWLHLHHVPATGSPKAIWPHPVAAVLDEEYEAALTTPGRLWTSEVYLTLWRAASAGLSSQVRSLLLDEPHHPQPTGAAAGLSAFRHEVARILDILSLACRTIVRLDGDAGATYLHGWISPHEHPVTLPEHTGDMSRHLRDVGFYPGLVPTLGTADARTYIRVLDLNYKIPRHLTAAVFRDIHAIPSRFDHVARWVTMDRQQAEDRTTSTQINILSTRKGFKAQVFTKRNPGVELKNSYVQAQADDADAAQKAALSDEAAQVFLTMTWLARSADPDDANRILDQLASVIRRAGCVAVEEDLNATEAYLGSLPGQAHANVRRLEMNTLNVTDLCVWHLPWEGVPWNAHLNGPAVCLALTDGCLPYHLNTHVGDLGHAVVIGPSGSGKSTMEAFVNYVQWLRYPGARTIGFDVGRSWECVTRALGGTFHDLGRGEAQLQALHGLDDPDQFPAIYNWLLARLSEARQEATPMVTRCLMAGLHALRSSDSPRMVRSLVGHLGAIKNRIEPEARAKGNREMLVAVTTYEAVIEALSKFAQGGVYGHLTDAPVDQLTVGRIHTFELEALLALPDAWPAVMSLLLRRMMAESDGSPIRRLFGEAWVVFRIHELMEILRDWMPSWRRTNQSGSFSTQSISQLLGNPLTPFLYESCQVRCFLPNSQALDEESRRGYEGMRLNPEELRLLTQARPKRDVYVVRPDGRRLIDLALPPMARSICGANSPEALQQIARLVDQYGPAAFPYRWLAAHGFTEAARQVQEALEGARYDQAATVVLDHAPVESPLSLSLAHADRC